MRKSYDFGGGSDPVFFFVCFWRGRQIGKAFCLLSAKLGLEIELSTGIFAISFFFPYRSYYWVIMHTPQVTTQYSSNDMTPN